MNSYFQGHNYTWLFADGIYFVDILKIDNLWCFKSLVKLQLDNNIIEKIEGLDVLVHLVWLGECDFVFVILRSRRTSGLLIRTHCFTCLANCYQAYIPSPNQYVT